MSIFLNNKRSNNPILLNTQFFILEGIVCSIILNLANPFFSMFARRMGANDYEIGMVSSLPALVAMLALIPGSLIVESFQNKKRIVGLFILLFGVMYPLAAITPILSSYRVTIYIIIIALMNWPYSIYTISWQSFFSDVMSNNINDAYTKRSRASTFVGTSTALIAGLLLAYIPQNDSQRILMYQIFFIVSFVLAVIQYRLLNKVIVPVPAASIEKKEKNKNLQLVKEAIQNLKTFKDFRIYTLLAFLFYVSWHMGWPLFFIYQVDVIGVNEAWLSYVNVAIGITGVVTYGFWGKVIQRKGAQLVLLVGAFGLCLNALTIVLIHSKPLLLFQNALLGLTFSAFNLAIFQNLIDVVPQKNKTINIAVYTTLLFTSQLVSPILGVWLYKQTSIVTALVLVGVFRLIASSLFAVRFFYTRKKCRHNG